MAFVLTRTLLRINFPDGHRFAGLTVMTKRIDTDGQLDLVDMMGGLFSLSALDMATVGPDELAGLRSKIEPMLVLFADALVSWDLELEGLEEGAAPEPVPATREGLGRLDFSDTIQLIMAWYQQVTPPAPTSTLGKGSPSGVIFPEGSLPMEPLSSSPLSLSVPG